jgi:hypothetical protein
MVRPGLVGVNPNEKADTNPNAVPCELYSNGVVLSGIYTESHYYSAINRTTLIAAIVAKSGLLKLARFVYTTNVNFMSYKWLVIQLNVSRNDDHVIIIHFITKFSLNGCYFLCLNNSIGKVIVKVIKFDYL